MRFFARSFTETIASTPSPYLQFLAYTMRFDVSPTNNDPKKRAPFNCNNETAIHLNDHITTGFAMKQIIIKDHPFDLLGIVDHVRQDGQTTKLYHWQTKCSHAGCETSWQFKTSAMNRAGELVPPEDPSRHYWGDFSSKFCRVHRPKTKRKTFATTYESRQIVSNDDVANMREIANSFVGSRADLYQCLSLLFGVTPGSAREILAGRRRATATKQHDLACNTTGGLW